MKLNREIFWKNYKKSFDSSVSQATVDSLNFILDRFEDDKRLKFISEYSYVLATAYHESGLPVRVDGKKVIQRFVPVKEGKGSASSSVWIKYQSKYWNTGYYGRGFVQITHKDNYAKIGELLGVGDLFVKNPDLMLEIKWAYEALVLGMYSGIYRSDRKGKQKLSRYFKSDDVDIDTYYNAREIINGDKIKNGTLIAHYADKFERILQLSLLKDAPVAKEVVKEEPVIEETPVEEVPIEKEADNNTPPAVEVTAPEPYGFIKKLKADVIALTGGNLTVQGLMENTEKIFALPLSDRLWLIITIILLIFSLSWIVIRVIHYRTEEKRKQNMFMKEIDINTNKDTYDIKINTKSNPLSII